MEKAKDEFQKNLDELTKKLTTEKEVAVRKLSKEKEATYSSTIKEKDAEISRLV